MSNPAGRRYKQSLNSAQSHCRLLLLLLLPPLPIRKYLMMSKMFATWFSKEGDGAIVHVLS